ncbi:MAG TPA: DUF3854 domain-containing protein [Verrucomicrobiae bacterium]|jgi:uncharacterized protein DUF3854|nr:DUF3854 domain-containing protein [Verrucomicrobiae bacterium]
MIAAQYIRSVPPAMIPRLLGFDPPGVVSALLFPFRSPHGGFLGLARVKIFPPLTDAEGHSVKYLQPKGSVPRLYFVASCLRDALESEMPLWLVEGEKKSLAVAQRGLPAIGFCGVEGWHVGGERQLLADFDAIRLRDRIVELLPDGDYQSNVNVHRAIQRFGAALAMRGARPRVVLLPSELPR